MDQRRRDFLAKIKNVGFAAAVLPIAASCISTGEAGIEAREIKIPTSSGEIPGFMAKPAGRSDAPVVLVIQEIFGVHEHIRDVCRRFAQEGYLAVAPDLFVRQGDVSQLQDIADIRVIVNQVPDAQVMQDLDATVAWARAHGDTSKLAATGFCWGGRIVWLYAAHNRNLTAGLAWYGRLVGEQTELQPRHPVDVAAQIRAPILGLYGGADTGIPVETVERMRAALEAAGNRASEIIVYPDAPHAFFADYRPSYREDAARQAWTASLAWLRRHGVSSPVF